jgi:hypothetical protein
VKVSLNQQKKNVNNTVTFTHFSKKSFEVEIFTLNAL